MSVFPPLPSLALLSLPSSILVIYLFFPIWEEEGSGRGVEDRWRDGGQRGRRRRRRRIVLGSQGSTAWLNFYLLLCVASWWFSEGPGCLESPTPYTSTTATQIPLLLAQLHRSHNLSCPLLLPYLFPPQLMIAEHVPSTRQQLFPLHVHARIHTSITHTHRLVGTTPFPFSRFLPFVFSHIIQLLPLLFTLRKIP